MQAGAPYGLKPSHTSLIRRIEGGMLFYHADADIHTNPYELGFDRSVSLDMESNFIGKDALRKIKKEGVTRKQVGLIISGEPMSSPNTTFWKVNKEGETISKITSAIYSPRLEKKYCISHGID